MTNLSSIVEMLAKQALGNNQSQSQQRSSQQGGLANILGSVLGHINVLSQLGGGSQSSARPSSGPGGSSTTKTLLIAVLPLVLAWIQKQGGLQGALDKLKGQGLNSQVDDWVSTGPGENANVDPQQVQNLFDDQEVEQVAEQTHVPKQDVYSAISQVLPQIIDSLTPQGEQTSKQEANNDIQNVLNMVSGLFKK